MAADIVKTTIEIPKYMEAALKEFIAAISTADVYEEDVVQMIDFMQDNLSTLEYNKRAANTTEEDREKIMKKNRELTKGLEVGDDNNICKDFR